MPQDAARVAIELLAMPSRARQLRAAPLPEHVEVLLRIAAGDAEAREETARRLERGADTVRDAANFFIEQVLLAPESNCYRVFGLTPAATSQSLRHNMALLLRWLHPDLDRGGTRAVFAARVTQAWDELKTPERRAAYDRRLGSGRLTQAKKTSGRHGRKRIRSGAALFHDGPDMAGSQDPPLLKRGLLFLMRVLRP